MAINDCRDKQLKQIGGCFISFVLAFSVLAKDADDAKTTKDDAMDGAVRKTFKMKIRTDAEKTRMMFVVAVGVGSAFCPASSPIKSEC